MSSKRNAVLAGEKLAEVNEILGFEEEPQKSGSLQPMEANAGKWTHAVDAQSLTDLAEIAQKIQETVDETVLTVARARLRIGSLLNEARDKFPGDKEFGQWRKVVLPDLNPKTATSYQAMAASFKNAPDLVETMGWATARALINASPEVVKQVEAKVESGEKVTAADVQAIKAGKPTPTSNPAPHSSSEKVAPPDPKHIDTSDKRKDRALRHVVDQPACRRIELILEGELDAFDEYSQSAVIFGFLPDICDSKPNMGTFIAVFDDVKRQVDEFGGERQEEYTQVINQAYSKMQEIWK